MANPSDSAHQSTLQSTLRELSVFALLVAIGVFGRWGQPEWCFTPIAAVSVFSGFFFARWGVAVLVPVACLAISDLLLPAYDQSAVMVITYLAMVAPVALGRLLRSRETVSEQTLGHKVMRWAACGLVPATLFFVTTNFAVWAFKSDYAKTWTGLVECYAAAVPFFRWMLAGDLFYLTVIFGCYALANVSVRQAIPAVETRD